MTDDAILELLRSRAESLPSIYHGTPKLNPVATLQDIESAEGELGLCFPTLLKRIYLEVANGGYALGPSYGILGLPRSLDNNDDQNVVKTTLELRDCEWFYGSIVICDWGCCMKSCIDCTDDDFPIYRFDGNYVGDSYLDDDPPDDAWNSESDTLAEWLLIPNFYTKYNRTEP